jgi:photosystem II stability/assembly factor-like uncharacterized protein
MSNYYKFKDGRVWLQTKKFQPYELLLPYGLTGVTDPAGNLNAIREPSAKKRGDSVIVDVVRGEPGLPAFQIETRLQKTKNFLFNLKDCNSQFQAHLGTCDRPDNYFASSMVFHWERSHRGDLSVDRLAILEGDNTAVGMQAPFVAEVGPMLFDMNAQFLSLRTILETESITAMSFLGHECFEDCKAQEAAGENGYVASGAKVGSAGNVANVWFTEDSGQTWAGLSSNPFAGGMDISDIVALGSKNNHRVLAANGTTRVGQHAQIAYADVTDFGTATWVTVDVGTVDGQYIKALLVLDWRHCYAVTDDGYIYLSKDGGATWTAKFTTGAVDFNDIAGLSNGEIWAVGNSELIVHSSDYGESWTVVTGPTGGIGDDCKAVCVTPDGTVLIGNSAGELYGTYDDGDEWTVLSAQGIVATKIVAIKCWGDSDIFLIADVASGSRVLRSIDGGATFRLWSLAVPTNSGLNALEVVDPNIVWVGGDVQGTYAALTRTQSNLIGL